MGKGAMRRASLDPNQFLSNQFTIPKKGDELRPVIDLKPLNHFVEYHHFKMEGLSSLLFLTRNIYFFEWKSKVWEFSSLPFEMSSAPRVFIKVMKLDLDDVAVLKTC